jgi:uncharacterized membrane protein
VRRGRVTAAAAVLAVAMGTSALFLVSRGKWSDAIVDSGSEWMYADSLARGGVLYRDVVYWFGPFTPYFQAAILRLFGSSFTALAISGIAGSLGALAALFLALRRVARRWDALLLTCLAIPAVVFMPNSGGSIIGMGYRIWHPAAFTLLAVALACRPREATPALRAAAVGLFCGLAALSRTEWGLIAVAGSSTGFLFSRRPRVLEAIESAGVALLVFAAGVGAFVVWAGRDAVLRDGHILLTGVTPETRRFLRAFSGIESWPLGLAEVVYSGALWSVAVVLASWAALSKGLRPGRRFSTALAGILVALCVSALLGGVHGAVLFSAAPLVCMGAIGVGVWRRGRPRGAAMAAFGLVGLLASHRRPFHITDAAYVGPPLLFAFVCAGGLLGVASTLAQAPADRRRLQRAYSAGLAVLLLLAFVWRGAQYASDERVPVPGTGGMLTATAKQAREISDTAHAVRERTQPGDALVVFPEGQVLNQLSGRANPLRYKLFIPGYLTDLNEPAVLDELRLARPRAVVVWYRPTNEYGPSLFGVDYGTRIARWIRENYEEPVSPGRRSLTRIYFLRNGAVPPAGGG